MTDSIAHTNFFGGSPLNRLAWLRPSHRFLNAVIISPKTRWVLFNNGQPLVFTSQEKEHTIAFLTSDDVRPLLGPEPFFGQGQQEGTLVQENTSGTTPKEEQLEPVLQSARHRGTPLVFLGLHEDTATGDPHALPSADFLDANAVVKNLEGTPMFSMDVADEDPAVLEALVTKLSGSKGALSWVEPRTISQNLDHFNAAVFAEAKSMVDWNLRNKFCAACGSRVYSMWGGWKLSCTTLLPWEQSADRKPCITAKGLHNFAHPRTDPVVIMLAIDETGDRALLGRNRRFPGKFYSALAGFIEPAESFEDAVKREMWEEAGVGVWDIKYHSGQPWPYPANLMVGYYARADSSKPIRVDLDNELAEARWFTRAEIKEVLEHPTGTVITARDNRRLAAISEGEKDKDDSKATTTTNVETTSKTDEAQTNNTTTEPPFRVPPTTAIAGVLIRDWAYEKVKVEVDTALVARNRKGHL